MSDPLLLYSTNTWLAYTIAETFYSHEHYVWCTPYFDSRQISLLASVVPPTSNPAEIYQNLFQEVRRGDRHSLKIKENRIGIVKGATSKKGEGVITDKQDKEIAAMLDRAETSDFRPLIYVMPYAVTRARLAEVPVADRAHPLCIEYLIERLPREEFDVLEPGV